MLYNVQPRDQVLELVLHCPYLPSCTNDHMHFPFVPQLRTLTLYHAYGHIQDPIVLFL